VAVELLAGRELAPHLLDHRDKHGIAELLYSVVDLLEAAQ